MNSNRHGFTRIAQIFVIDFQAWLVDGLEQEGCELVKGLCRL
ncbi:hypothetical protein [Pseudomonas sp. ML2-2023-6]